MCERERESVAEVQSCIECSQNGGDWKWRILKGSTGRNRIKRVVILCTDGNITPYDTTVKRNKYVSVFFFLYLLEERLPGSMRAERYLKSREDSDDMYFYVFCGVCVFYQHA